ncbi:MAG TPA: Na-translocating system protein MpsC family protein [Thermoleophilaceae bacterium]
MANERLASAKQSGAMRITNGLVHIMSQYTGRGPTRARTTVNTNVVVAVFHETLTKAEQNLVAAGNVEAVEFMRTSFDRLLRSEAISLVEGILERKVVSMLTDVDPDANIALQAFILDPVPEDGIAATAELSDA